MLRTIFITIFLYLPLQSCAQDKKAKVIMENAKMTFSNNCKLVGTCIDISVIDCEAATDGPLYYINHKENALIQCCGGCCDTTKREGTQCSECPPRKWKKCKEDTTSKENTAP